MNSRVIFVVVACSCALHCMTQSYAQDPDRLQEQFIRDAATAWEKYHAKARKLQGSVSIKAVSSAGTVTSEARSEFKQTEGCAMYVDQALTPQNDDTVGTISVANPLYVFQLRRSDETKNWTLHRVALRKDLTDLPGLPFDNLERWADAPITLIMLREFANQEGKGSLWSMIKEPGFTVKAVLPISREGTLWAKVEFIYETHAKSPRVPALVSGWVLLDPDRLWSIQEDYIEMQWPKYGMLRTYAATYSYDRSASAFPLLKYVNIKFEDLKQSHKSEFQLGFSVSEKNLSELDFTLSAFGFKEPAGVPSRTHSHWYLWIGVTALLAFAMGALFRYYKHRFQAAAARAK